MIHVFAFLVKKTFGILFYIPGPKNKIPKVFITKTSKKKSNNIVTTILLWIDQHARYSTWKKEPSIICIKISNTIATIHKSNVINIKY